MLAHSTQVALLVAPFTVIAGWSLMHAWRTGKIKSRGWTFGVRESPIGFWLVAVCDFLVFGFGVTLAFYAFGVIEDPLFPITIKLPQFLWKN